MTRVQASVADIDTLLALGQNSVRARVAFTKADLCAWCPHFAEHTGTAINLLKRLRIRKWIVRVATPPNRKRLGRGVPHYALTEAGAAQSRATWSEHLRQTRAARAHALHEHRRATNQFALRLWSLLRIRRSLTAGEAAELLTDAGDVIEFRKTVKLASSYMRKWTLNTDAVQISKQRAGRYYRYVVFGDPVAMPPT